MKLRNLEEELITSMHKTRIEHEIDMVKTDVEEIINEKQQIESSVSSNWRHIFHS